MTITPMRSAAGVAIMAMATAGYTMQSSLVSVNVNSHGYTMSLFDSNSNQNIDFLSVDTLLLYNGTYLSANSGSLIGGSVSNVGSGQDAIGVYEEIVQNFTSPEVPALLFSAIFRMYPSNNTLVFKQTFVSGIPALRPAPLATYIADETLLPVAAFPYVQAPSNVSFGLLTFKGEFAGSHDQIQRWPVAGSNVSHGGFSAIPNLLVCPSMGCHLLMSPLTHALTGFQTMFGNGTLWSGFQNQMDSIPAGYSYETVFVATGPGPQPHAPAVAQAFDNWGAVMLAYHGKQRFPQDVHPIISSLGYCTNVYYFYCPWNADQNSTVGDLAVMHLRVQQDAQRTGLPHQFHFFTSQWYGEHEYNGVVQYDDGAWGHMPERFPGGGPSGGGMAALWDQLHANGLQAVSAHLGQWLPSSPYTSNSSWQWWSAPNVTSAVPYSPAFWTYILGRAAREWGLKVLEQDHMNEQFTNTAPFTLGTLDGFEAWLGSQSIGATAAGVYIEYCMDSPHIIVHSPTVPMATHSRASGDYVPTQASWQWDIAIPSTLLWSLGMYPSKDTYYTNRSEVNSRPHDPVTNDCMFQGFSEPHPDTHHFAAVLSTGLVQPSDGVGQADVPLILTAVRSDGTILKPDRPLMRVERWWAGSMFNDSTAPQGTLSSTYSVHGCYAWHYVMAVEMKSPYALEPVDLFPGPSGCDASAVVGWMALPFDSSPPAPYGWTLTAAAPFGDSTPLNISVLPSYAPQLYLIAPVFSISSAGGQAEAQHQGTKADDAANTGVVLFGEVGKVTAMSHQRVNSVAVASNGTLVVDFIGDGRGESVTFGYACVATGGNVGTPATATCAFPATTSLLVDCTSGSGTGTATCV